MKTNAIEVLKGNYELSESEMNFPEWVILTSQSDPGFFRWLFDNPELDDFVCDNETEWVNFLADKVIVDDETLCDCGEEIARYNIPYDITNPHLVDYSIRFYNVCGYLFLNDGKSMVVYPANLDEIGSEDEDYGYTGGWWNIDEDALNKYKSIAK